MRKQSTGSQCRVAAYCEQDRGKDQEDLDPEVRQRLPLQVPLAEQAVIELGEAALEPPNAVQRRHCRDAFACVYITF